MSAVDQIFDPENTDNIVIYDENGEPVEFEQIAVIPLDGTVYVILHPVVTLPGCDPDMALVFFIEEKEDDDILVLSEDREVIDKVFAEYYEMINQIDEG